jgi:hypothetical protein
VIEYKVKYRMDGRKGYEEEMKECWAEALAKHLYGSESTRLKDRIYP